MHAEMYNRADFNRLYDFLIDYLIVIVRKLFFINHNRNREKKAIINRNKNILFYKILNYYLVSLLKKIVNCYFVYIFQLI